MTMTLYLVGSNDADGNLKNQRNFLQCVSWDPHVLGRGGWDSTSATRSLGDGHILGIVSMQ